MRRSHRNQQEFLPNQIRIASAFRLTIFYNWRRKYGKISAVKTKLASVAILATFAAASAAGQTNVPPAEVETSSSGLKANAGADMRVRQEIMHNVPGLPGAPGAVMPKSRKER